MKNSELPPSGQIGYGSYVVIENHVSRTEFQGRNDSLQNCTTEIRCLIVQQGPQV